MEAVARSQSFAVFCSASILVNAVIVLADVDDLARDAVAHPRDFNGARASTILQLVCCVAFLVEVCLRFYAGVGCVRGVAHEAF